ncbi:MAG: ankyrin repeat domain-containing protein [Gammaproteobacteria bacterium]
MNPREIDPLIDLLKELKPLDPGSQDTPTFDREYWDEITLYEWKSKWFFDEKAVEASPIKRIRFLKSKDGSGNIIDVIYANNKKQAYLVPPEIADNMEKMVLNIGARSSEMLKGLYFYKFNWQNYDKLYSDKITANYKKIHAQMLELFEKEFKEFLEKNPDATHVNLIDAGCGKAPDLLMDLEKRAQRLAIEAGRKNLSLHFLGFDYESDNIKACLASTPKRDGIKFIQGDMNFIEDLTKDPSLNKAGSTFLFSSGSMTRKVLNNAFECLRILQADWRAPISCVIASGENHMLFNERMLKRIGYKVNSFAASDTVMPLISFERIPEAEVVKKLNAKLVKKPESLDLSMNPAPIEIFKKIDTSLLKSVRSIDISFSHITDYKEFSNLLIERCPNLQEIKFNSTNPKAFQNFIRNLPPHINLKCKFILEDEHELLGSEKFLSRIGASEKGYDTFRAKKTSELMQRVVTQYQKLEDKDRIALLNSYNFFIDKISHLIEMPDQTRQEMVLKEMGVRQSIGMVEPLITSSKTSLDTIISFFITQYPDQLTPLKNLINPTLVDNKIVIEMLIKKNAGEQLSQFCKAHGISLADMCKNNWDLCESAVKNQADSVFKVFQEFKVDLCKRDENGNIVDTLLYFATRNNNANAISTISSTFPNLINIPDVHGRTPLHYARGEKIFQKLLESKPDLNIRDKDGNTLLHRHIGKKGGLPNLLIEKGADITIKNNEGLTPLEIMVKYALNENPIPEKLYDYETFNTGHWLIFLTGLYHTKAFDLNDPNIRIINRNDNLSKYLEELTRFLVNQIQSETNYELMSSAELVLSFKNLLEAVATKFNCKQSIQEIYRIKIDVDEGFVGYKSDAEMQKEKSQMSAPPTPTSAGYNLFQEQGRRASTVIARQAGSIIPGHPDSKDQRIKR